MPLNITKYIWVLCSLSLLASCNKTPTPLTDYTNVADCTTITDSSNTYTNTIKSIVSLNCNRCHNSADKSGAIDLSTYTQVKEVFIKGNGLCSVHHGKHCHPMPSGSAALSSADIQKLDCWVKNGCKP